MSDNISLTQVQEVALSAAKKAGAFILTSWERNDVEVSFKDRTNLVTQYDLESERIILEELSRHFPRHRFLTEETHSSLSGYADYQEPLWIVDPIDGTTNFTHRHPHSAVSIGFALGGEYTVGVVHNPFTQETFTAIRGHGAFRNDTRISCRAVPELSDALIATGFPYQKEGIDHLLAALRSVLLHCREVRRLGAASLDISWVADGRLDGFYETLSPWDVAAAFVIAREAGLTTGTIFPLPAALPYPPEFHCDGLLVTNATLFPKLQKLLADSQLELKPSLIDRTPR